MRLVRFMSYSIYITRAKEWYDEFYQAITESEWLDYVKSDPEMTLLKDNAELVAQELHYNRKIDNTCAVWFSDSEMPDWYAWFNWSVGKIYTKGIENYKVEKMIEIAKIINANVLGDNDEKYYLSKDY